MDAYQETLQTWNSLAALYEERFMDLPIYNASYDKFLQKLKGESPQVLEVGSGPGNICRYMLAKKPNMRWLGTDAAPEMVSVAQKNNPTATFKVMDARFLNSLQTLFDGVVSGFCIPYLDQNDVETFLRESYRLLETSGVLYLSFVSGSPTASGYQTGSSGQRVYFYFHESGHVEKLLTEIGFSQMEKMEVVYRKSDNSDETHTILIGIK